MISQRTTQRIARRIWGTLFTLVIALAVFVQLGREAFPLLNDYRDDITAHLGKRLGVNIQVGKLAAAWTGLRPEIELYDVVVTSEQHEPIFKIAQATVQLSLVDSLLQFNLRWRQLAFHQLETTLLQDNLGQWQIKNAPVRKRTETQFTIDDPLDIFLFGRRVEMDGVTFNLEFRTGHSSALSIPSITLENDRNFHRASVSASVLGAEGEERQHLTLIMEGTGDPRDPENFDSSGYLALHQFPMEKVVAAFAGGHWQAQDKHDWAEGHRLDLELWYRGTSQKGMTFRGKIRSDGLPLEVPDSVVLPEQLSADVTGHWHAREGWEMVLQQFALQWPDFSSPPMNIQVSGGVDQKVSLGIDHLEVEPWHQLAQQVGYVQGKAHKVLSALQPAGTLNNLAITMLPAEEGYFRLNAALENVSLKSYRGSPVVENLDGFVSASAFDGTVDIRSQNGFSIGFPRIYAKPQSFERAKARVGWTIDRETKTAYVHSGVIELVDGDQVANGLLHLILPTVRDGREPHMTLAVGMDKGPLSLHKKFVPKVLPSSLRRWLNASIGEGSMTNLGFIYHGSIAKKPKIKASIQLRADIHKAQLTFDPHWPTLNEADGLLTLHNGQLDVRLNHATIQNNRVDDAVVLMRPNPDDEGMMLSITGKLSGRTADAMALLHNSPVRNVLGETLGSWTYGGNIKAGIDLSIPLKAGAKGLRQRVNVDFERASINLQGIDLAIDSVGGRLVYRSDEGLVADKLSGRIWGQPFNASIKSPAVKSLIDGSPTVEVVRDTEIHFSGPVAMSALRQWTHRPELGFMQGTTSIEGVIILPAKDTTEHFLQIEAKSALSGVEFRLPTPFNKSVLETKPFSLNLKLYDGYQRYQFDYAEIARLRLQSGDGIESSGQLSLEAAEKPLQPGFFDVNGKMDLLDLEVWDEVYDRYLSYGKEMFEKNGIDENDANLPIRLDLAVGAVSMGQASINDMHINGLGNTEQWALRIQSEMTSGNVIVKGQDDQKHLSLDLDYLKFDFPEHSASLSVESDGAGTTPEITAEEAWSLATVDLSKITFPVNFSVKDLRFSNEPYGRWAFDLKPLADGISLTNIQALIRGVAIGDVIQTKKPTPKTASQTNRNVRAGTNVTRVSAPKLSRRQTFIQSVNTAPHAEFIWRQSGGVNHSYFNGTLMASNVGTVLEAWGVEKILESRQSIVSAEVAWQGAPDEINLDIVSGEVIFDLEDGSFIRGSNESDNGLLRLIALFNFDTLARRLKLDFSDLAKEGFGFESVHGEFDFENGWIYINEPMVVDSTSSKLQVAGTLDVINEKIDAELVATLPVAGDITIAAALVAGLPAAVGVFLISKMFEEQVDKASSLSYEISGEWEDPKLKFRQIFDDTAATAKGRKVKSLERESSRGPNDRPPAADNYSTPEPTPLPE